MNRFKNLSAALKGETPSLEQEEKITLSEAIPSAQRKGKKEGKRSDPSYIQVGVYVPKSLHLQVKKLLLEHPEIDMSDLVGRLLQDWVDEQHSS